MSEFIPAPKRAEPAPDTSPSWKFIVWELVKWATQAGTIIVAYYWGNHNATKIDDKHDDTTAKIAEVEKKQDVTHEKLSALKEDVRKGP